MARGIRNYTNMAGSELEDLASLEAKVVNEAAWADKKKIQPEQNLCE